MLSALKSSVVLVYEPPGVTVHLTFELSQAVGVALQLASCVTTQVGRVGEPGHKPVVNAISSVVVEDFQPPVVVAKSSKTSG